MNAFAPNAALNSQQHRAARRANRPPSPKHINELAERAEATGCDRCGARFAELLPYFVCRTTADSFSVRCADCSRIAAAPVMLVTFHGIGGDPWSQDDRDWFASHPTRRWRLRDPWRGEAEALAIGDPSADVNAFRADASRQGLRSTIATFQVEVGKRKRAIVAIRTNDPLDSFTDAGIVRLIPGLADRMHQAPASEAEWHQASVQKMADRLRFTAAIIKGGAA